MALVLGGVLHNGAYKKIFEIDYLDNDVAGNLAVDFTAVAFASVLRSTPNSCKVTHTALAADLPARFAVTAMTANGCTVRLIAAGGGAGGANTIVVTIEALHSATN